MKATKLPDIPVSEIFKALRNTEAGKSLRSMCRYGPYRDQSESIGHWRKVLGPSAVTYFHMQFVYKALKKFVTWELKHNPKAFDEKELRTLLLAATIHDFGEALVNSEGIGDIVIMEKTKSHERVEHEIFKKVRSWFLTIV